MPDYDSFAETPGMFAARWLTRVLRGVVAVLFAVLAYIWLGETLHIFWPVAAIGIQIRPPARSIRTSA